MNKTLTVVIPTYNMERFLRQCLDSFIDDVILRETEIIIINDGSKDSSSSIAMEYVYRYPDSFFLIDKENGGHGSTINKGISVASGKYFKVVDSDDWIDTNGFISFVQKLKNEKADCVITRYNYYYQDSGTTEIAGNTAGLPIEEEFILLDYINKACLEMHGLCFKTSILKDNNIRLFEHCFYADVQYSMYPLPYINSAVCYDDIVYQYRLNREGQSVSAQGFIRHYLEHERITESVLEFLDNSREVFGDCWEKLAAILTEHVDTHYRHIITNASDKKLFDDLRRFDKRIKTRYSDIYKRIRFHKKVRLCIRLNFVGVRLLRKFSRIIRAEKY